MDPNFEIRADDHGQPGKLVEEVRILPDGRLERPTTLQAGETNWLEVDPEGNLSIRVFRGFNPDEVARWAEEHGYTLVKRQAN